MLKRFANGTSRAVSKILTGDETWICHYDPETKRQSKKWVEESGLPPTKFRRIRSVGKQMWAISLNVVDLLKELHLRIGRQLPLIGIPQYVFRKNSVLSKNNVRSQVSEESWFTTIMLHHIQH
ncbi:Mariner transposase [Oopsacas minuta]|uniref:Mariner transposase n=1 Tax=Oopsacas minuta TaxID=111878 RepID=A0AAV7JHX1_9METZ|nr:Mariner transposase [Oopsacas minuta]